MSQQIAEYALIGDMRTAALVGSNGSIDWLSLPRFDSPAMFAALVGDDRHGQWLLAPVHGGRCTRRRYRNHTMVLETVWVTPQGEVRVSDFMAVGTTHSQIVRIVEGIAGETEMQMRLSARMEYGQTIPNMIGRRRTCLPDRRVPARLVAQHRRHGQPWGQLRCEVPGCGRRHRVFHA